MAPLGLVWKLSYTSISSRSSLIQANKTAIYSMTCDGLSGRLVTNYYWRHLLLRRTSCIFKYKKRFKGGCFCYIVAPPPSLPGTQKTTWKNALSFWLPDFFFCLWGAIFHILCLVRETPCGPWWCGKVLQSWTEIYVLLSENDFYPSMLRTTLLHKTNLLTPHKLTTKLFVISTN